MKMQIKLHFTETKMNANEKKKNNNKPINLHGFEKFTLATI